jgi:hypothetical protein
MARQDKITVRSRAYYEGELVTVLDKGKRKSTIRTSRGFPIEGVPNKDLDFDVEEDKATLRFEPPTG